MGEAVFPPSCLNSEQTMVEEIFIPIPKKGNAKECSRYYTIALILHASKVVLKILQVRLQQYMNHEFSDVQAEFRKGRGTRIKLTASIRSLKKQENSRKSSALLTMPKPLTVWITTNCGKFFKRWEYQTTWPASWEIPDHLICLLRNLYAVRTRHETTD